MTSLNSVPTTSAAPVAEDKKYANFRDFNTVTCEGRVLHTEVRSGQYGEFANVTIATTLKDGEQGIAIQVTSSNGILKLAKGGHLMAGRRVHITGQMTEVSSHYVNADGLVIPLARPRMNITAATLKLGAKPRSAMQQQAQS